MFYFIYCYNQHSILVRSSKSEINKMKRITLTGLEIIVIDYIVLHNYFILRNTIYILKNGNRTRVGSNHL